jgi:disulfide bond formation protein DsbB
MLAPPMAEGASRIKLARLLALLLPSGLLGGALFSQYVGGLYPCEMCYWQRWPHAAAILLAIGAYLTASNPPRSRILVMLAALAVAISGAIGVFHAGVEMGWWEGITQCTATGATSLQDIMKVPLVRCDQVQWEFLGISMAGWNAILSLTGAAGVIALARRSQ